MASGLGVVLMTNNPPTPGLDAVAEAIWRAGFPRESADRTWRDLVNKTHYRMQAQAAFNAIQGSLCDQLSGLADAVRDDIKEARKKADAGNEEKSYLRGELQGVLAAFDLVSTLPGFVSVEENPQ